ncbi:MAG: family 43 glycosylhydrolase [Planctomycetaceae bacterium]|nr:family 43 glycosylhydrolase [Planctomycetaceae bacterium]
MKNILLLTVVGFSFSAYSFLFAEDFRWNHPMHFEYSEGQTAPRTEVRDPCIIRDGDGYYMVFTMWPFRNREESKLGEPNQGGSPGIAMYRSTDLRSWTFETWLVKSDELPENCPYKNRFWAPEIHKIKGKYYLVFTADNWIKGEYNVPGKWGTAGYAFIGVADKVAGPYEHITWVDGGPCDMSLFGDDDGTVYAVSPKYDIFVRRIDLSRLPEGIITWVGDEIRAVACKNDDVGLEDDPDYLEGPWMEKINGEYYLFHAAIYKYPGKNKPHEYWTQLACSDHPMGPWKKDARVRVFLGGHLAIFDGPDGKKWYCYRNESGIRGMHGKPCIDPVEFNPDGSVVSKCEW